MTLEIIHKLFIRDLNKLRNEIDAFTDEFNIWIINKSITNSAGNLCLHLVGNLNFYIGTTLGQTGYKRNREQEFTLKGLSKRELLFRIDNTIIMINNVMPALGELDAAKEYPILVLEEKTSIEFFMIHLVGHLNYHLGQINYHRRILDK